MSNAFDTYIDERFRHQIAWYRERASEYREAAGAGAQLQQVLLAIAAVAGLLGLTTDGPVTGIVAATCAAVAALIEGWMAVMGFERNAMVYESTADRLESLPDPDHDDPVPWVLAVERTLLGEVDQWADHWIEEIRAATEGD